MDRWFSRTGGTLLLSGSGEALLTYRQLDEQGGHLAGRLRAAGVSAGDTVCAVLPNGPGFAVSLAACWSLGAIFAPFNPQLTEVERKRVLAVAQPRAILSTGTDGVEVAGLPTSAGSIAEVAPKPEDALLLFTSGSTGTPKAVILSHRNLEAGVRAVVATFGLGPEDLTPAVLPWTHGHGLIGVLLASARAGASVVLDSPSGLGLLAAGRPLHATWISAVPPLLALLCDRQEALRAPTRLRFIRTASAPLPRPLAERAERLFDCPLAEAYGMTETTHQAAANPPDLAARRLGTVGLPTGVEVREVGETVSGGRELEVRGEAVFRGYLGRADLSAEALTPDGWYRTRDVGVIDSDGYVRLIGRTSEIINRGGFKISPAEVEESLATHPSVSASLVAAIPHAVLGEEIAALVVARRAGLTVADLRRHCRLTLAAYKQPGLIKIVAEIPRLPNGKPSRRLAAELLRAG